MVAVQLKAHEAQGHFIHSESSTDCFANITCQCNFASLVFLLPAFTCEMGNNYSVNYQAYQVVK